MRDGSHLSINELIFVIVSMVVCIVWPAPAVVMVLLRVRAVSSP